MTSSQSLLPNNWLQLSARDIACLAPLQLLHWPLLNDMGIEVAIKREELLDPKISGNKFYKLYGHLKAFQGAKASLLGSFGGAYSNHIYALAAAGQSLGISTLGVIRGEEPKVLSPTLLEAKSMGMRLLFVSREEYKKKNDPVWRNSIQQSLCEPVYWVPEGGGDELGAEGCAQWGLQTIKAAPWKPTHICVAAGTGGTAAGLLAASSNIPVHAFLALKGKPEELNDFSRNIRSMACSVRESMHKSPLSLPDLVLESDYHCGGYAKLSNALRGFMLHLEGELDVLLDPVYTAKLFWGIAKKAESGYWPKGSRLLVFHTGGLQGRKGYEL